MSLLQGMGHVIGYCGDGFNDIPAIHATDLGIAVGASEAAVTAPIFTSDVSTQGKSVHIFSLTSHLPLRYLSL